MKTTVKILSLLLSLVLLITLVACDVSFDGTTAPSSSEKDETTIRVGGLKGPTTIGMVKLMQDSDAGNAACSYEFSVKAAADELTPLLLQGKIDIISVPANLAAVLYAKTKGQVKVLAVNTLGVQYIVEKGSETVQSMADLRGKTIYASGQGTVNEYNMRYLLAESGVDPDSEVTFAWKSEPTEVLAALKMADNGAVAMLPQPAVTGALSAVEGLRIAVSLDAAWSSLDNGSRLVTGVTIARAAFVEEHPALVQAFLSEYKASIEYVNAHPDEMGPVVETYIDTIKGAVAKKAIPACNIAYMDGDDMKQTLGSYLSVLFSINPASVGGAMPGADFYYGANPDLPLDQNA